MFRTFSPIIRALLFYLCLALILASCGGASDPNKSVPVVTTQSSPKTLESRESVFNKTENTLPNPLYRLYNIYSGEHLYTQSQNEYVALGAIGWIQEDIAFYAFDSSASVDSTDAMPWLRVYNPNSGMHHWTSSQNEYDTLGQLGWIQESASGYIFDTQVTGSEPLYRLYNQYNGTHHWTMDSNERTVLISRGWTDEGVAGYVYNNIGNFLLTQSDTTPDNFTFENNLEVIRNSLSSSNEVRITGIDTPTSITVNNGEYRINDGVFTTTTNTISNNDFVQLRHTSSNSYETTVTTTLVIGEEVGTFSSTTITAKPMVFKSSVTNIDLRSVETGESLVSPEEVIEGSTIILE